MTDKTADKPGEVALEAIAFQDNRFGKSIEAVFAEMLETKPGVKEAEEKYASRMVAIIKEFTNLTMKVEFDQGFFSKIIGAGPRIFINLFNNHHPFLKAEMRGSPFYSDTEGSRKIMDYIKERNLKNTIDVKRAWVTGFFADAGELAPRMIFPMNWIFKQKLTPAELTGVFIHEVGHAFTVCEYANRYNTTNQVLATMMRARMREGTDVQEIVFKEAGELLGDKNMFARVTENVSSDDAVFTVMLDAIETHSHSETGTHAYDFVTCEQQADQFASRMGYGRHIVTALDKAASDPRDKSAFFRHAMNFYQTVWPIIKDIKSLMAAFAAGPQTALIVSAWIIFGMTMTILSKGEGKRKHTYDNTRVRYLRIREDLIQRLKDTTPNGAELKGYLEDFEAIDKVVDSLLKTENKNYIEIFMNFVFSNNKKLLDQRTLQRQLEELASNDLYRMSAVLRSPK